MLLRGRSDLGQEGFGQATQMCLLFFAISLDLVRGLGGMVVPLEAAMTRRCAS